MLARLDGILLCRKTVCVISHRVQHVEPPLTLVTRIYVARDVAERMPNVQTRTRRIREHVEHIEFRFVGILDAPESMVFTPMALPTAFYFLVIIIHNVAIK